jgi:CRP-like cAMP-binding protein
MGVDTARLNRFPLFEPLTDAERASVAVKLEERTAEQGAHLTSEGGGGYFFFLIDEGTATVTRGDQTLAELGPGDFFGEAGILEGPRRNATVTANTPMKLLELFGADFAKLTADIPAMGATIRAALEAHHPPA